MAINATALSKMQLTISNGKHPSSAVIVLNILAFAVKSVFVIVGVHRLSN